MYSRAGGKFIYVQENIVSEYPIPNLSNDLSGQVALVTGTTSGLGKRFAQVIAASGAKVAVTGRRVDRLEALASEINAAGGTAEPIHLDMQDNDSIIDCVNRAEEALGTVTILVNNAGIPDAQRAHKMSLELIDSVFDTNLRGPYVLSCEIARRLIAAEKPGRMVNIYLRLAVLITVATGQPSTRLRNQPSFA